jgi:hypothetical protein
MGGPNLLRLLIFIFFDFSQQIVIPIAFGYLHGQFHKFLKLLLFSFLLIFL